MHAEQPLQKLDAAAILHLAEGLAVRYALESFQRGNLKVNSVRPLLETFAVPLAPLRDILHTRERKTSKTGNSFNSHAEIPADALDRRFWSLVPESEKQAVLLSSESW